MHVDPAEPPEDLVASPADVPDSVTISRVTIGDLPADWRRYPAPELLADIGTDWAREGRTPLLAVPSAVVPQETNYLLNPRHPDVKAIRIGRAEPFRFDPRM